jgi:hypothetical protein
MPAEKMKMMPRHLWWLVALSLALGAVGFFYAYYYSWIVTTPGVPEDARRHYDFLARMLGIPSLVLLAAGVGGAVWLLLRKKAE